MSTDVQEPTTTTADAPAAGSQLAASTPDAPMTNRTGAMGFGLAPRTFDEAWRMASIFANSSMVPKAYHGKPEDILVAILYGHEIGLPPMAALQSVAVINGRPGVYSDGFLGVIMSKPAYLKHLEFYELSDGSRVKSLREDDYKNDATKAVAMFWRRGNPDPFVEEFSIGAAKRAKLWGKEGPWSNYPARQLMWRARSFAGRNGFAAELRGIKMAEELRDTDDDPIIETTAVPSPLPAVPLRRSEKPGAATPSAGESAAPPETVPTPAAADADAGTPTKSAGAGKTADADTATADEFKQVGPGQVVRNVRITNTALVDKKRQGNNSYYELQGVTADVGTVGATMTWLTQDEQLYRAAASCEGAESRFDVTYHTAKTKDGKKEFKVITGLQAAD